MNLISMKYSFIVVLVIVVSSLADDNKWSEKPKIARRIKRINQKLISFKQVAISSRESCETAINDNYVQMNWGSAFFVLPKEDEERIEKSVYLYCIIFVGIVIIILIFYIHVVYPEHYLSKHKDHQL